LKPGTIPKRYQLEKNIFYGCFVNGLLYAVADYGIGVNAFQASYLTRLTGFDVSNENMLELKRLCRIEPKDEKIQLTEFIAKCHKLLIKLGYRFIVSFSDPMYGHNGGIYKAANFKHLGTTSPEVHVKDSDGNIRHRRYPCGSVD